MHPNDKNNRYLPTGNQCTPQTYGNRRRFFSHSSRLLTRNRGYSHCEANGFDNELEHCNNHGMYFRRGRLYQRNNRWITNRGASSSFTRDSNHRRPTYSDNQTVVGSKPNLQSTTNSVGPSCSVQDSYSESVISSRALQSSIVTLRSPKSECQDDLRSNLIDGLRNNTYQCMICISKIRSTDPIWSCTTCYHIYHLLCIKSWAKKSSQKDNIEATVTHEWRCPSCQANYDVPSELISYQCFCGRTRNPEFHPARVTIPHSCDQLCGKVKRIPSTSVLTNALVDGYQCTHLCTEICHPGPCPPCLAAVTLKCPCGKVQRSGTCGDPHLQPCGQICGRQLSSPLCAVGFHMCLSLCHYGPCPPCRWLIQTACFCGRMDKKLTCGNNNDIKKCIFSSEDLEILRTAVIELQNTIKSIDYTNNIDNLHNMSLEDDSLRAENNFDNRLTLYLSSIDSNNTSHSNVNTMIKFNDEQIISFDILFIKIGPTFSCDQLCDRLLNCTHHNCSNYCHSEKCPPCLLDPKWCLNCPCGKTPLSKLVPSGSLNGDRKSCIDPVPTCPNLCGRPRSLCGHPCSEYCHTGSCPPCKLSIHLKCRCGYSSKMVTCHEFSELSEKEGGAAELCCERICKKRLVCGRHKCQTKCCNDTVHQCLELCGRRLPCQTHYCEEQCHSGPCNSCWRGVIYSELVCRCGYTVLQPPQPCGSTAPECNQPCNRTHNCEHPVRHNCHMEPTCPPCTVLMIKDCPGGHGVKFNVPCFQEVHTCGRICNKPLSSCSHHCQRLCHSGSCLVSESISQNGGVICTQLCQKPRPDCGHPCNLPCHEAVNQSCLETATRLNLGTQLLCSTKVDVTCMCGKRKQRQHCHQVSAKKFSLLEQKQSANNSSSEVIRSLFTADGSMKPIPILPCNDSCNNHTELDTTNQYADTNTWKRGFINNMHTALPNSSDETPFNTPEYPEHLKQFALRNFTFVESVEKQLKSMVMEFLKANTEPIDSKNHTDHPRVLNYYFPPMNKRKRQFIHDIVEFYGMESFTYGLESNRYVMVIARRGYCKLPGGVIDHRGSLLNILKQEFPNNINFLNEKHNLDENTKIDCHLLPISNISTVSYAQILRGQRLE